MFSGGYKIKDENAIHYLTFAVVEWVDVFARRDYSEIVIESLKYCIDKKGLQLYAWVIMPNHVHLIASAKESFLLSDILRDLKKHTSKSIVSGIEINTKESRRNWMLWIFNKAPTYRDFQQERRIQEIRDISSGSKTTILLN